MIRSLDALIRSNLFVYTSIRRSAVFLCRYFLLEEGFSLLKHIHPRSKVVAVDVGSNDGTSIEMIRQIHPHAPIHSFDPVVSPKRNYHDVEFHQIAIGDRSGELELYVPQVRGRTLTQYSSSDQDKATSQLIGDFKLTREQISFTHVLSESMPLDNLDLDPYFIKIDVEGQEDSVIKGAINTIKRSHAIMLVEIQSLEKYRLIRALMTEIGYFNLSWPQKARDLDFDKLGSYSPKRNNYLWLPRDGSKNWDFKPLKESR